MPISSVLEEIRHQRFPPERMDEYSKELDRIIIESFKLNFPTFYKEFCEDKIKMFKYIPPD